MLGTRYVTLVTQPPVTTKDVLFLVTRLVAYWPAPIHAVAHANLYCRHVTSGRRAVCYSQIRSILSSATAFPTATLRWQQSNLFLGRPGRRLQIRSGKRPSVMSTWHRKAWWAGVSSASLVTWPKSELRRRMITCQMASKFVERFKQWAQLHKRDRRQMTDRPRYWEMCSRLLITS